MRLLKQVGIFAAVAFGLFSVLRAQQRETFAWAPLPVQPNTWVAPNQPIWRLSELLAKHKGQPNWSQTVVDDSTLHADYVSMAPGAKTPRRHLCMRSQAINRTWPLPFCAALPCCWIPT